MELSIRVNRKFCNRHYKAFTSFFVTCEMNDDYYNILVSWNIIISKDSMNVSSFIWNLYKFIIKIDEFVFF